MRTIIILLSIFSLTISPAVGQSYSGHKITDCPKDNCRKQHHEISIEESKTNSIRLETTRISSGLTFRFGPQPKRLTIVYKVYDSQGNELARTSTKSNARGDVIKIKKLGKIHLNQEGFAVYLIPFIGSPKITYYDAHGRLLRKEKVDKQEIWDRLAVEGSKNE